MPPLDMSHYGVVDGRVSAAPLERAYVELFDALDAERYLARHDGFWRTAARLDEAGRRDLAQRAAAAAMRLGGDDGDMRWLLDEIDRLIATAEECGAAAGEHTIAANRKRGAP